MVQARRETEWKITATERCCPQSHRIFPRHQEGDLRNTSCARSQLSNRSSTAILKAKRDGACIQLCLSPSFLRISPDDDVVVLKMEVQAVNLNSSSASSSSLKSSSSSSFQIKMKFLTFASTLVLAGLAVAAPNTAKRRAAHERRIANSRTQGHPLQRVTGPSPEASNDTFVEYSSNWAGAILIGSGYKSVTGTFTVPTPTTAGSGAAWVGIDGDTCDTAILQTGIDWTKSGSSITYDAWYEWYPDYSYDFSGITLKAGNTIKVTVTATSLTGGTATVENVSTGKTVSHTFSNEGSEGSLCETNAEWIVEDYEEGSSLVKFADFGTITFTGASALEGSTTVGTTGATIIDIEQNGKVLTDCSVPSSSEVTCSYV